MRNENLENGRADRRPPRPETFNGDLSKLPPALAHLKDKQIWVCWCWYWNGKKWTKPPRRADNPTRNASSSDPTTWGSHAQAVEQVNAGAADGIGIMLKGCDIGGVDLDHCCDVETSNDIDAWAEDYINQFPDAYREVTVSGTGLRILGTSELKNFAPKFKLPNQSNGAAVELFSGSNHYLTVSCNELSDCKKLPAIGDRLKSIAERLGRKNDTAAADAAHIEDAPPLVPTNDKEEVPADTAAEPWSFAADTRLRSALRAIPTDEKVLAEKFGVSHETWVKIGRAIERLDWGERGYAIWRDWCAQNGREFNEKGLRTQWASFKRTRNARDNPVTIATVFHLAKQCGWSGLEKVEKDGDQKTDTAPLIKTSAQFISGFVPPDYVVTGLLQRRFLYACTGQTGAGKTAITLRLAASVALGAPFADRKTKRCRVLYAAAENPDDVRMRWIALTQHMGFDPEEIDVFFIEGRFTISKATARLRAEAERAGGDFGLVIIDTGPAFFEGDDENNRAQMGAHARLMRGLITAIPGHPCIVVNCHPVKNATSDNLLPAGGGTFLNEIDGNLTAARTDNVIELHWQGKFRGPEFAAMNFMIRTVTHQSLKDSDGLLIPTVICECIGDQAREEIAAAKRKDEDEVLKLIEHDPAITLAKIAQAMNWKLFDGRPHKTKATRCIERLKRDKLVKETRAGHWQLTPEGKKVLEGGEK
jgi:hypothetical protein